MRNVGGILFSETLDISVDTVLKITIKNSKSYSKKGSGVWEADHCEPL